MSKQVHSLNIQTFVAKIEKNELHLQVQTGVLDDQAIDHSNKVMIKMSPYATWLLGEMVEAMKSDYGPGFGKAPASAKDKR